jgi:hypothetical protein
MKTSFLPYRCNYGKDTVALSNVQKAVEIPSLLAPEQEKEVVSHDGLFG